MSCFDDAFLKWLRVVGRCGKFADQVRLLQ